MWAVYTLTALYLYLFIFNVLISFIYAVYIPTAFIVIFIHFNMLIYSYNRGVTKPFIPRTAPILIILFSVSYGGG